MNAAATLFLILAVTCAVIHWWSVAIKRRSILLVTKPLTMVLLIGLAASIETTAGASRAWFIAALVLSLAGDVFLMLEPDQFIAGLASFLAAHLAYIIGLVLAGFGPIAVLVALAAAIALFPVIGRPILAGARAADDRLAMPVAAYIAVISAMVVAAAATTTLLAVAGATSFFGSDAVLGWNRFVKGIPRGRLITMITYHTGQTLLVLSLVAL
ncbi:lysoplasmalogenase [Actinomycetota bacterium]